MYLSFVDPLMMARRIPTWLARGKRAEQTRNLEQQVIDMVVEDAEFYAYGKERPTTSHAGQPSTSTPTRTVGGLWQSGGEQTPNQEIQLDASQATD